MPGRRTLRHILVAFFLLSGTLLLTRPGVAGAIINRRQTEVLFLSFSDPDLPDFAEMVEEVQTQILEGRTTPIHFSFEYLDPSLSAADPIQKKKVQSYLYDRYRGHVFNVVVVIGEQALIFAEESRAKFFPAAALVFFVVDPINSQKWITPRQGRTGVIQNTNYTATLKVALAQNPGTRHVVIISGASQAEQLALKKARAEFRPYETSVDFREWTTLTFEDLSSHLASLEPTTVVLFLNFLNDGAGAQFVPAQILPGLSKTATCPIYGTYASLVGNGAVGGSVANLREIGRILGQDAVRVLNGRSPEHIPVVAGEFQRFVFDWPQLHRWGIPDDQLPVGSALLHWQASPWDLYRWRILGLAATVAVEMLLILLLLHTRATQKRTEETLLHKKEELSEAQRLARVGSWQWNPSTDAFTWSDTLYDIVGFDRNEAVLPFKAQARFFTPESWHRLTETVEEAMRTGQAYELELEGVRSDGAKIWVAARGEVIRDSAGRVITLRGTMHDISNQKQIEEVLLRYATIVESSDDAIISQDLSGIILTWNVGAQRIFGFSVEEAVGKPISIIIPTELRSEEQQIVARVKAGEQVQRFETARVAKAGQKLNVMITISPLTDRTGKITGYSKIVRDVTELTRAQKELQKSEEKFAKAFHQAPLAITLTDLKTHRYIDVNTTYERWTGLGRQQVIGRSALEVGLWEDPSERERLVKRLLVEGSVRDVEYRFRSKDGEPLIGLASVELIEVQGDTYMLAAVADITDRKRAEQALAESERRFRLMADSAPVLMWLSGPDKLCTDFNQEWLKFTGRTIGQELGNGWTEGVHPDDLPRCFHTYSRAFDERQQFVMEYRLRRHDGQYRWVLDRGVPRFLEDGTFAGYIGCCIDITDEKEAKAERAELSGRLIHAQEEERARIARELHDDINQRLALLANGLQELERNWGELDQPEHKEHLQELWQETSDIANDIQHLSHQLHPSKLHYLGLAAALRELCHEFSKLHKIEVHCVVQDVPKEVDHTAVLSLYRAVQESLRNVAKHSHAQHVKVELTADSKQVRIRVSDDGVGFDVDLAKSNHGLGLVSMQERLRLAGGEFSIWSRPSFGTQLEGTIPLPARYARSA